MMSEGKLTPARIAILGRNRFVFDELETELKNNKLPFKDDVIRLLTKVNLTSCKSMN